MKPLRVALVAASTYEGSPSISPLRWACADAASFARLLRDRCQFDLIIVLNQRPAPLFTEGHLRPEEWSNLLRLLASPTPTPIALELQERLAFFDPAALPSLKSTPIPSHPTQFSDYEEFEGPVIAALNDLLWKPPGAEVAQLLGSQVMHNQKARILDSLIVASPNPEPTDSPDVIEFRGPPTRSKILETLDELWILLDSQPDSLFLFAYFGHGFHDGLDSFLLLPGEDNPQRFLKAHALKIRDIQPKHGSQIMILDVCQNDPDADDPEAPAGYRQPQSRSPQGRGPSGSRNLAGWIGRPIDPSATGLNAVLHTSIPGEKAHESDEFTHGHGCRVILEAINGGAWETLWNRRLNPPSATARLTWQGLCEHVQRELSLLSKNRAHDQLDPSILQAAYVNTVGIPKPVLLGTSNTPPPSDPRIHTGRPRIREIDSTRPFEFEPSGLPFVAVPSGSQDSVLMAVWTVRWRDLAPIHDFLDRNLQRELSSHQEAGRLDHPVTNISFSTAVELCALWTRLGHETQAISRRQRFDLPTERQWCRAAGMLTGTQRPAAGNEPWCTPGSAGTNLEGHSPIPVDQTGCLVDAGHPRAIPGIFGLAGNIWEWVQPDPILTQPGASPLGMARGQSFRTKWSDSDKNARIKLRKHDCQDDLGFRLAIVPITQ